MTPAEQRAFDLMQKALREVLLCVPNAQKVTLLAALTAANAAESDQQRCQLCKYENGHSVGCENKPADLAMYNEKGKLMSYWGGLSNSQATEPEDYKLVPVNATPEMIAAAEQVEDLYRRGTPHTWGSVYRAMLSAVPEEKKNG